MGADRTVDPAPINRRGTPALVPAVVARLVFPHRSLGAWLVMAATMVVDLDHLPVDPIYDPSRCSIGFHPLHGAIPIVVYLMMCVLPNLRVVGLGLTIHVLLDSLDCYATSGIWRVH